MHYYVNTLVRKTISWMGKIVCCQSLGSFLCAYEMLSADSSISFTDNSNFLNLSSADAILINAIFPSIVYVGQFYILFAAISRFAN